VKLGGADSVAGAVAPFVVGPVPPPKISKTDPPELPEPDVPKLELAPVPLAFEGGLIVELKEEVGAVLPELDDPELPGVLSDCESATNGHERAMKVAIRSRLEIIEVVEKILGQKSVLGERRARR